MGDIMKSTVILLVLLAVAGSAVAADQPRELSPLMQEITASFEAARLEIADLKLRYEAAVDDSEALAIMREISRVKHESRIEMMRIQLRHARLRGNDELVAELEEIVARMTAPPRKGVPIPREAPQQ